MPDEYRISELQNVSTMNNDDLVEVSQVNASATSGYVSLKARIVDLAKKIVSGIQFTTDLNTTDKTVSGAINEINDKTDDEITHYTGTPTSGSTAEAIYKAKYHVGDTISLATPFVGYISSSSKRVRFTIPLDKPLGGDITGINFANVGDITLYGGSGSDTITPVLANFTFSLARSALYVQYDHTASTSLSNSTGCTVWFGTSGSKITFT